ncbi:hypothetical protein I350_03707 [Cryptococcus amylolentus CBS 6273]|uniref:FAM86 N-terminal domain-containing protein n=1 Tax=Cryptococcus amylolentus CBS 6273 TaxID=1296118 RepID=A0A1E3K4Z4_9TREE|nr:hypothetical protein I350_03707 [Cryptococcus amylolentus CBS 6273]
MSQESLSTSDLQALVLLQRQYFALYPPYRLTLPDNRLLASPLRQEFIIQQFLGGREGEDGGVSWIRDFQPEQGYQAKFWRRVVAAIENGVAIGGHQQGDEWVVDDEIYDHVSNLMVSSSTGFQEPRPSYRTFIYDLPAKTQPHAECTKDHNGGRITLLEEQIVIQSGTTGLRTWQVFQHLTAALHLGHHLIQNLSVLLPPLFALNRGFIEIGAGTGLISILLSHLGFPVIATDLGDNEQDFESESSFRTPLGRLHTNLSLNSYSNEPPEIHHLDWFDARKEPSDPSYDHKWADLVQAKRNVIAADVIYDPDLVPPLVDSIDVLLGSAKDQLCAVVAATVRNETTFESFLAQCAQHHLTVKDIKLPPIPDANPTFWDSALDAGTRVAIMRITRKPGR